MQSSSNYYLGYAPCNFQCYLLREYCFIKRKQSESYFKYPYFWGGKRERKHTWSTMPGSAGLNITLGQVLLSARAAEHRSSSRSLFSCRHINSALITSHLVSKGLWAPVPKFHFNKSSKKWMLSLKQKDFLFLFLRHFLLRHQQPHSKASKSFTSPAWYRGSRTVFLRQALITPRPLPPATGRGRRILSAAVLSPRARLLNPAFTTHLTISVLSGQVQKTHQPPCPRQAPSQRGVQCCACEFCIPVGMYFVTAV